jgi:hypothetical protein
MICLAVAASLSHVEFSGALGTATMKGFDK